MGGTHTIIQAAFYFTLLFRGADGSLILIEGVLVIEIALIDDCVDDDVIDLHDGVADLVRSGSFGWDRQLLRTVGHGGDEPVLYTRPRRRDTFPDAIVMAPVQE